MKYTNGSEIRINDHVKLSDGSKGIVVFSIDTDEYSDSYPKNEWSYLKKGIMIKSQTMGLVHLEENTENLVRIDNA